MRHVRLIRHLGIAAVEKTRHEQVERETVLSRHDLRLRVEESMADQLDELAAAGTHHRLLERDTPKLRQFAAQGKGRAVRVEVDTRASLLRRSHGGGGGPQCVLVGGQLHDVLRREVQLTGGLLNGFAGLVSHQPLHVLVAKICDTHGGGGIIPPRAVKLKP